MVGGTGSRLWPLTAATNKHLLPVHDKPMIYYSLTTLMFTGVRDIAIVSSPGHIEDFKRLLGNGTQWGLNFSFVVQTNAGGIAECFSLVPDHFKSESVCLILGDNILYGMGLGRSLNFNFNNFGSQVFAYPVSNPSSFGTIQLDRAGKPIAIEEKPIEPKSNLAIPGIYYFDNSVWQKSNFLKPSLRNELEITDLLNLYLVENNLKVVQLERGTVWIDAGTSDNIISASEFIKVVESRQGFKLGCPEEVALRLDYISKYNFDQLVSGMPESDYKKYLSQVKV
jgi:glucose-1-phosphate thymidylyltransferase